MPTIKGLFIRAAVVIAATGLFLGCQEKAAEATAPKAEETVALVKTAERSAHFAAVTKHLELGGTVYGYVDVDGDMARLAVALKNLADQATTAQPMAKAFVPEDFAPVLADLGFGDVKAVGFSSVASGDGRFRNRVFLYTPGGRHGLLAGLGGAPGPFTISRFAPADADFVYETEVDTPAAYAAVRAVVARVAGEPAAKLMDAKLDEKQPDAPFPARELVTAAKGRFSLVLRIDETKSFKVGPAFTAPVFDLALRHEHGGAKLAAALADAPFLQREDRAGGVTAFVAKQEVPMIGWRPEILIEGDAITAVSRASFLAPAGAKLADDAAFRAALAPLGDTGNGLTYVGPRFSARAARLAELNPGLPAEQQIVIQRVLGILPEAGSALVSIRQNLPEGVLFRSQWSSSLKSDLMLANPPVVIAGTGLMAAMAIPAFQKVRAASQEKAVLNNLRQLAAARDQYFLETGKTSCTYADLVGAGADKYIRELKPVAGEDYTRLSFRQGEALRVKLSSGKVVEYSY